MSENIVQLKLLQRILIQLWDKWPKCLSEKNSLAFHYYFRRHFLCFFFKRKIPFS